jgi:cell division protein FtsB
MDFQLKKFPKKFRVAGLPRPEDGLRAFAARAPQAEALAVSWIEQTRPVWEPVYVLRRRIATIAVACLACFLFVHVMLGANGMVVYRQKKAEYRSLQVQVRQVQEENAHYTEQIEALKTDPKAIEREAREQLRYVRPGEFVYVQATLPAPAPPTSHSAKR